MRFSRLLVAVVTVLLGGLALGVGFAHAQSQFGYQLLPGAGLGYTDNSLSAPKHSGDVKGDVLASAGIAARLAWLQARASQQLFYRFGAVFFLRGSQGALLSHDVNWNGLFAVDARTDLGLRLGLSLGRLGGVAPTEPVSAMAQATPYGPQNYLNLTAGQTAAYRPNARYQLGETLTATYLRYLTELAGIRQPPAMTLLGTLSAARLWARQTLSLDGQLGYLWRLSSDGDAGVPLGPGDETLYAQLLLNGTRELSAAWTVGVGVGGLAIKSLQGGPLSLGAAWLGTVAYRRDIWTASLTVNHSPRPNVYLGATSISDRATLRAELPLSRDEAFRLGAYGAYDHARQITLAYHLAPAYELITGGINLSYHPLRWPVFFALDYSITDQEGHEIDGQVFASMSRQLVLFTITGTFPRETIIGR